MGGFLFTRMPSAPQHEPPTTYQQQIALLRDRGLTVSDDELATHCLAHHNYFRLIRYRRPFLGADDRFKDGARFEDLWALYRFDVLLRHLLLEALKRVELSVRARWSYVLSHSNGPMAHEDTTIHSAAYHDAHLASLDEELKRSEDLGKWKNGPGRPPIWIACESMSFGLLSRFYSCIFPFKLKKEIAAPFSLFPDTLKSLLEHSSYVRNLCAHHLVVWDRKLTVKLTIPIAQPANSVPSFNRATPDRIYNTIVLLGHMMDVIEPGNDWMQRVESLVAAQPVWVASNMGFHRDWQRYPVWERRHPPPPKAPIAETKTPPKEGASIAESV